MPYSFATNARIYFLKAIFIFLHKLDVDLGFVISQNEF
jgi:hypothetical protein